MRDDLTRRGLILIQIDGLARPQLEQALKRGNLPFLMRLIEKRGYTLGSLYSGMPSSTPAVQGELFYGVKCAVPAFGFRNHTDSSMCSMLDGDTAKRIEDWLSAQGQGVLRGGSSYSNIYTGGAAEAHFCSSRWGRNEFHNAQAWRVALVKMLHITTIPMLIALGVIELLLAVVDFFRGLFQRRNFFEELKFIPARVFVCLLLREWVTRGAQVDIVRGLPIIHLNFLGYDEQSHRRGPSSAFAHWTLNGIDGCIRKIWNVALLTHRRHYDLWIYSDHGQEDVVPYRAATGHSVTLDLEKALADVGYNFVECETHAPLSRRSRVRWMFAGQERPRLKEAPGDFAGKGPVGHVYLPSEMPDNSVLAAAENLVRNTRVPMVAVNTANGITLITASGPIQFPEEASTLFDEHPFRDAVVEDLATLLKHPDAGRMVLFGWAPGVKPISFPLENGSHAGPGENETHGFVLLPQDAPIDLDPLGYIRPLELRDAVLRQRAGVQREPPMSTESVATRHAVIAS